MYNPISLNVVRQSLHWMGAPRPRISSSAEQIISPSGTVMKQISLIFDWPSLLYWAFNNDTVENDTVSDEGVILNALQSCFCGDIQIVGVDRWGTLSVTVSALCSITARD